MGDPATRSPDGDGCELLQPKDNRGNNGSVNIIVNFGWAGSAGRLILFPMELKAPNRGTFRQSKQAPRAMRFL